MIQLTAPNAICGRVIGRGGSKINSITVRNLIQYPFICFLWLLFTSDSCQEEQNNNYNSNFVMRNASQLGI